MFPHQGFTSPLFQFSVFNCHGTRHTAHGTRHTAHGTRHTAHGHGVWGMGCAGSFLTTRQYSRSHRNAVMRGKSVLSAA
ncbi:hypothetical protein [Acetobacter tropicalis]|uniref:hypothetical protein n=1 Tax=Acetobacter tropicalis TaxID=104102 RepID=UPI00112268A9|nr:hypothetical protein [Acetobacter tropicalis]